MQKRIYAIAEGLVQGVGYRWFIAQTATRLGLIGYVRNLVDGTVEMEIQGEATLFESFFADAQKGPFGASVSRIKRSEKPITDEYSSFEIRS